MAENSLHQLSLHSIVEACRDESNRKRQDEQGFCFELFKRAIECRENDAWLALQQQYQNLILDWIHKATKEEITVQVAEDLLQDTFTRFWRAVGLKAIPLSHHFEHVGGILRYLNRCAVASCLDWQRRLQRTDRLMNKLSLAEKQATMSAKSQNTVKNTVEHHEKMQMIQKWIQAYVTDEQELLVIELSYAQGLKPREIVAKYPQRFQSALEVRRIKERILKRARRSFGSLESKSNR